MQPLDVDRSHPAFGNLFVQTEWIPGSSAILAMRRPRSMSDKVKWCGHVAAVGAGATGSVTCETDRAQFIGRGRSARDPVALDAGAELSGTVGAVLDPIFSLRATVTVPAGRSAEVTFTTFVGGERENAIQLADLYHDSYSARRALDLSWAQAQAELRDLGISPADAALYQELAGHLIYPHPGFKGLAPKGKEIELGQNELWSMGISGDYPILLATLEAPAGLSSVRQLLRVHHYWRLKGLACDLVILSLHPPTYLQELHDELLSTVLASSESGFLDRPGGVFIRRADLLNPEHIELLYSIARIQVDCDGLGLGNFLEFPHIEDNYTARVGTPLADPAEKNTTPAKGTTAITEPVPVRLPSPPTPGTADSKITAHTAPTGEGLSHFNGIGGFNSKGEYEIRLNGDSLPPAPWVNVIGNPVSGCLISEGGS